MKTILVTGAAGFLGSHICDFFLDKNYKVIGIDNLLTGLISNLSHNLNKKKFDFLKIDICKKIKIKDDIDYIFHLASPASPSDYLKYPIKTLRTGSLGTENILKLAEKKNAITLVASTSEIYGDPLQHPQSENYYGNVNPVGPRGAYDEAKRYLEAISTAYKNKKKLNIKIARIFNTYGPRMRVDDGRVIPNFINQALENREFTIYGNGTQTRSFCYVDDTVNGLVKLIKSNYNKPVNIGNPTEYSILDLLKLVKKNIKTNSSIIYKSLPENDPKVRRPNISLAKEVLEWYPKTGLEDGLIKTIRYFKILHNFKP